MTSLDHQGAAEEQPPVVEQVQVTALPLSARVSLVGIFVIMLVASLYLARAIVLPLVLATLLALTAAPLIRRLARRGISPVVTALLLAVALASVVGVAATLLSAPISDMVAHAPTMAANLREKFDVLRRPFVTLSEVSKAVTAPTDGAADANTVTVVDGQPSLLDWLLGNLADVGSTIVATLLLAPFLLASSETLKLKLIRLFPALSDKKRSLRVLTDIEHRVSRYLITVAIINSGLGICIGTAMWVLGMPNPLLWGVGATLLNFVPYIGPFTGIGLAAAVSLSIHPDLLTAAGPPLAYAVLNSIEGTLITPLTVGRRLSLSILAILITLGLTTWMWGIVGTLIGVPLLVVVKAFCDEFPSLSQIGMFISAESEPIEEREEVAALSAASAMPNGATSPPPMAMATGALVAPRADHAL